MRYVRKDRRIYDFSHCRLCGVAYGGSNPGGCCPPSTCLACGTKQCLYNGLGSGCCKVCLRGLLPGWSGTDRPCNYKGCRNRAVCRVPRKGFACRECAEKRGLLPEPQRKDWVEVDDGAPS